MKKIFPTLAILLVFTGFFFAQFALNSDELNASKATRKNQVVSSFEHEFKVLDGLLITGEKFSKKELIHEYTYVNFWASWCVPCLPKLKQLSSFYSKNKNKMNILGINLDDQSEIGKAKKLLAEYNSTFPNIVDNDGLIGDKFLVKALPYGILFKNGKVVEIFDDKNKLNVKELKSFIE